MWDNEIWNNFRFCLVLLEEVEFIYSVLSCRIFALKSVEVSFFMPHGITSLATHATSTYYWFFG